MRISERIEGELAMAAFFALGGDEDMQALCNADALKWRLIAGGCCERNTGRRALAEKEYRDG